MEPAQRHCYRLKGRRKQKTQPSAVSYRTDNSDVVLHDWSQYRHWVFWNYSQKKKNMRYAYALAIWLHVNVCCSVRSVGATIRKNSRQGGSHSGINTDTATLPINVMGLPFIFNGTLLQRHSEFMSNWQRVQEPRPVFIGRKATCFLTNSNIPLLWPVHQPGSPKDAHH